MDKKKILLIVLAVILCFVQFLTLNAIIVDSVFSEKTFKKAVSSDEFIDSLILETTGGLTTTPGEDAIILDEKDDTTEYMKILEKRKKFGLVIDDVIVAGLRTETISDKFSKVALSYAESKILGKKFEPLTEEAVTAMKAPLDKELEHFDVNVLPKNVAQNISLDFKFNPHKLSSETNDYLQKSFEQSKKISGVLSFGYNLPILWLIISLILAAAIIVISLGDKLGFLASGAALVIASIISLVSKSTYISLFGTNQIVKTVAEKLVGNTVNTVSFIAIAIGIILIAVYVVFLKNNKKKRSRRSRRQTQAILDI